MTEFALYIHYPFCLSRCPYCGFATAVEEAGQSTRYREALLKELAHRAAEAPWQAGRLHSLYLGGGSPSLMPPEYLARLLDEVRRRFQWPAGMEVTIEANPGTTDLQLFTDFHHAGVNRLSIGAQSFDPAELELLGRRHTPEDITNALEVARRVGFDNISLDILYGIPGQSVASFTSSVRRALELGIDHLSAYSLSIETGTPFEGWIKEGKLAPPDPDLAASQFAELCRWMREAGFEHYELTNFARPGCWSRHNFAYWQRSPYLGLGTGAHSFDGRRRFWNPRQTGQYLARMENGEDPAAGEEILSTDDALEELVYLSLRTREGLDIETAYGTFSRDTIDELLESGFLFQRNGRLHIPEERWLLLDEIVLRILEQIP